MLPTIESTLLTHIRSRWIASGRELETLQFPNSRHDPRATDFFAAIDLLHTDANRELIVGSEDRSGRRYTGLVVLRIFARRGDGTLELARAADLVEDILSERRLPLHDPESERVVPDHWTDATAVWEMDDDVDQYFARDSVAGRIGQTTPSGSAMFGRLGKLDLAVDLAGSLFQNTTGLVTSTDFTIMQWIRTTLVSPEFVSMQFAVSPETPNLTFRPTGSEWVENGSVLMSVAENLATDVWEHWAVRRLGSQLTIFRNGTPLAAVTDLPSTTSVVGAALLVFSPVGLLDQIAVFDSAVSDADIAAIYNGGNGSRYASPASFRGTIDLGVSRTIHVGPSEFEGKTWYQYNVETAMSATIFPRS